MGHFHTPKRWTVDMRFCLQGSFEDGSFSEVRCLGVLRLQRVLVVGRDVWEAIAPL